MTLFHAPTTAVLASRVAPRIEQELSQVLDYLERNLHTC